MLGRGSIVESLIRQYADHLRNERNMSPHTLRNYLSDLTQFNDFLRQRELAVDSAGAVDAGKVDIHVVRAYLASLAADRKKSSIGRKLAALKGFFRYLVTEGHVEDSPAKCGKTSPPFCGNFAARKNGFFRFY